MSTQDDLSPEQRLRVRRLLDQGAEGLDVNTVHRLAHIRAAALRGERVARPQRRWFMPALGAALVASVVAVVVLQVMHNPMHNPESGTLDLASTDMELLLAKDDLEFYGDLDFYVWLEHGNVES